MVEYVDRSLDLVFAALADPTRRAILAALEEQSATVTQIAHRFPTSLNAISKHIKMLERAGLVHRKVSGREHHCSLCAKRLRQAATWIEHYRQFWTVRLEALERHVIARRKKQIVH